MADLHIKSRDELAAPHAPAMNLVFTVCDNAANEAFPFWSGQLMTAARGIPDPVALEGTLQQIERAFRCVFSVLDRRIDLFLSLPL
jgi:arsenate reductase